MSGNRARAQPPKSKSAEAAKLQGRTRPKSIPYGRRSGQKDADSGVRRVAATYGKVLLLTSSPKASDRFVVESDAERVVTHLLTLDPGVQGFVPQPFTVDLVDGRILWTPEEVEAARKRHRGREGRKFYTPDFEVTWLGRPKGALETKLEGFEGDAEYDAGLPVATLLACVAARNDWARLVDSWPWLTPEHVEAARRFAQTNDISVGPWPVEPAGRP